MPLGEVFAEAVSNVTSVRYTDIGGGQTKIEIDVRGEVKGRVNGVTSGTFSVIRGSDPAKPGSWTYVGRAFLASGAIVAVSGQGLSARTGDGQKVCFRGSMTGNNDDPKLAELNNIIAAFEGEADPMTGVFTGANCVWK
jgi:hypothetical protein